MRLDLERERDVRAIVSDAFRLFFGHFPVFFTATLVVVAPVVFLVDGLAGEQLADGLDARPPAGIALLSAALSGFVIPPLVTALHVRAVQGLAEGVEPEVGRVLREAVGLFPVVLVPILLYTLGVFLGLVLFVVPGIYLAVRWYFNAQAVVVDGARGSEALRVSWRVVEGSWLRVFGILLVLALAAGVVGYLIGAAIGAIGLLADEGVFAVLTETFGQTIAASISALGGTLLFFDLRFRKGAVAVPDAFGNYLPPRAP